MITGNAFTGRKGKRKNGIHHTSVLEDLGGTTVI